MSESSQPFLQIRWGRQFLGRTIKIYKGRAILDRAQPPCLRADETAYVLKFDQKPLAGLVQECFNKSSAECRFIAANALGKPSFSVDESPVRPFGRSIAASAEVHRPRPNTSHQEAVGLTVN